MRFISVYDVINDVSRHEAVDYETETKTVEYVSGSQSERVTSLTYDQAKTHFEGIVAKLGPSAVAPETRTYFNIK